MFGQSPRVLMPFAGSHRTPSEGCLTDVKSYSEMRALVYSSNLNKENVRKSCKGR